MPNRVLSESVKRSEQIDQLSWFDEVVFYRALLTADDYGCLDGRPKLLKSDLFPTRDDVTRKSIEESLAKLTSTDLLRAYEVSGKPYMLFPTWEKHQRIRRKKQKYPWPCGRENDVCPYGAAECRKTAATCCQSAADCGQVADSCRTSAVNCPPESESESESNPNPTSNPKAHARDGGDSGLEAPELQENPYGFSDASGERPNFGTIEAYASSNLRTFTPGNMQELVSFKDDFPDEVLFLAIDQACGANAPAWNYVRKVLNNWLDKGVKTAADAKADIARGKHQANPPEREREIKWAW